VKRFNPGFPFNPNARIVIAFDDIVALQPSEVSRDNPSMRQDPICLTASLA
jgi:hypothetical protein